MVGFWVVIMDLVHPALKNQRITAAFTLQHHGTHSNIKTAKASAAVTTPPAMTITASSCLYPKLIAFETDSVSVEAVRLPHVQFSQEEQ